MSTLCQRLQPTQMTVFFQLHSGDHQLPSVIPLFSMETPSLGIAENLNKDEMNECRGNSRRRLFMSYLVIKPTSQQPNDRRRIALRQGHIERRYAFVFPPVFELAVGPSSRRKQIRELHEVLETDADSHFDAHFPQKSPRIRGDCAVEVGRTPGGRCTLRAENDRALLWLRANQ